MDDRSVATHGSHDGQGASDNDRTYAFGCPACNLTIRQQAKLTVLRGQVMDARHGEHGGPADGDVSDILPSGLIVPLVTWRRGGEAA